MSHSYGFLYAQLSFRKKKECGTEDPLLSGRIEWDLFN